MARGRRARRSRRTPLERALAAKKESKTVDFKASFDPSSSGEWCEVIKDIVSMANSGGGVILFGVADNGRASGWSSQPVLTLDPAQVTDKIAKYTGEDFGSFTIVECTRNRARCAALIVAPSETVLVFEKPGTYDVGGGRQKTAFAQGTVYFRHGAKSEPARGRDLRDFVERRVRALRRSWLGNIRKIATADPGSVVTVSSPGAVTPGAPVNVVLDGSGADVTPVDFDQTHPHRQKDVLERVKVRLPSVRLTTFDIQVVRYAHDVHNRVEFSHKSRYASRQYSDAFIDWMVDQFNADPNFFAKARDAYRARSTSP